MTSEPADQVVLHHVIVAGGSTADWASFADDHWQQRLHELGKVADHAGARWLVLRPVGGEDLTSLARRSVTVGACTVVAEPAADGRARLARAIAALQQRGAEITELAIDGELNAPAEVDPDLVVVLAPSHRMPASLVWELAYSELVYLDVAWQHFAPQHLDEAIASYAHRHRRFGGVD